MIGYRGYLIEYSNMMRRVLVDGVVYKATRMVGGTEEKV